MDKSKCKCTMAISAVGDGCRYCQPQEYIDRLEEWLDEERKLVEKYNSAAIQMYQTFDDCVNDLDFDFYSALSKPVSELRDIVNGDEP